MDAHSVVAPAMAARLASAVERLASSGRALASFAELEPDLASLAGVEVAALEARAILSGGSPRRVCLSARECAMRGTPATLSRRDLDAVGRLEGLVALSSSRLEARIASLDSAERSSPVESIGSILGVATGAIGLIKSIF